MQIWGVIASTGEVISQHSPEDHQKEGLRHYSGILGTSLSTSFSLADLPHLSKTFLLGSHLSKDPSLPPPAPTPVSLASSPTLRVSLLDGQIRLSYSRLLSAVLAQGSTLLLLSDRPRLRGTIQTCI